MTIGETGEGRGALDGRSAVVTGGGSGIGKACAIRFAELGAKVTVADVNAEAAQLVAAQTGGTAWEVDLSEIGRASCRERVF